MFIAMIRLLPDIECAKLRCGNFDALTSGCPETPVFIGESLLVGRAGHAMPGGPDSASFG
jgi:hypothetical protein